MDGRRIGVGLTRPKCAVCDADADKVEVVAGGYMEFPKADGLHKFNVNVCRGCMIAKGSTDTRFCSFDHVGEGTQTVTVVSALVDGTFRELSFCASCRDEHTTPVIRTPRPPKMPLPDDDAEWNQP